MSSMLLFLLLLVPFALSMQCGNRNCGGSMDLCCGNRCYNPNTHSCLIGNVLCGIGENLCKGSVCYDPKVATCFPQSCGTHESNDVLCGVGLQVCGKYCYDPIHYTCKGTTLIQLSNPLVCGNTHCKGGELCCQGGGSFATCYNASSQVCALDVRTGTTRVCPISTTGKSFGVCLLPSREAICFDQDKFVCCTNNGSSQLVLISNSSNCVFQCPTSFSSLQDEVPQIASSRGNLNVTLVAEISNVTLAGQVVTIRSYNNSWILPTLRVKRGDIVFLRIINHIDEQVNFHFHGMILSPLQDNIFIGIFPKNTFNYLFQIPMDHPQGLYWYHAHVHPLGEFQIMNGMAGLFIVEGILNQFPKFASIKEQLIMLKDIQIQENGTVPSTIDPSAPTHRLINGLLQPTAFVQPGEIQFWRIANIGSDIYYNISLNGIIFHIIGTDGFIMNQLVEVQTILIPPASRIELFLIGPPVGSYSLIASNFSTGPAGDNETGSVLLFLNSNGKPTANQLPLQISGVSQDLRNKTVNKTRTIVFSENEDPEKFLINGKEFNASRVDTVVLWGTLEEWIILNNSTELHVFHIHQVHFQVVEINHLPTTFYGQQDTVNMPFKVGDTPGQLKLRISFSNPEIVGKFVYHCHILEHQDGGMMATIYVVNGAMRIFCINVVWKGSDCVTRTIDGVNYLWCPRKTRSQELAGLVCTAFDKKLANISGANISDISKQINSVWVASTYDRLYALDYIYCSFSSHPCVALVGGTLSETQCTTNLGVLCT